MGIFFYHYIFSGRRHLLFTLLSKLILPLFVIEIFLIIRLLGVILFRFITIVVRPLSLQIIEKLEILEVSVHSRTRCIFLEIVFVIIDGSYLLLVILDVEVIFVGSLSFFRG